MGTPTRSGHWVAVAGVVVLAAAAIGIGAFVKCGSEPARQSAGVPAPPSMDDSESLSARARVFHERASQVPPPGPMPEQRDSHLAPPPAPPPPAMPPLPRPPSSGQLANPPVRPKN